MPTNQDATNPDQRAQGSTDLPQPSPPTIAEVKAAAARLRGRVRQTPVMTLHSAFGAKGPQKVSLKLEHLQHSGTFKARGATNFVLTQNLSEAGVVAASGGNHGAAVAWAAKTAGIRANIFVPTIAAKAKVERLRNYGATVHQTGSVFAEAYAASEAFRSESGATSIHAYNDPVVMAGAGTTGLEFQSQLGQDTLDSVLVACGGGGLSGGIAAAIGHQTTIVVCETEGTATFASARAAGTPVTIDVSGLGADALGASILGTNTWAALSQANALSKLVTDEQLQDAQNWLWDNLRLLVEPAAAAPVAVLLGGKSGVANDDHVGIVLCGANVSR